MKRFTFHMTSGYTFYCIALSFHHACMSFDNAKLNPLEILSIEEK